MVDSSLLLPSPIESVVVENRSFLIKRDDCIHPEFDGNKARKLFHYLNADLSAYDAIVSWGGNQSNAMYSLSAFAKMLGKQFIYYTKPLPKTVLNNPSGNWAAALQNGMRYIETTQPQHAQAETGQLYIPMGAADSTAEKGLQLLASEITAYSQQQNITNLKIVVASGTGATALYLQKHLEFDVYTVPCAGTITYLQTLFHSLSPHQTQLPICIDTTKKYYFGKLYAEQLTIWQQLQDQTGITFDLLYDPKTWLALLENIHLFADSQIMYIHCGGTRGNNTMLARYSRASLQ